jgi:lipooligosaccharide transport system permease protein
MNGEAMTAIATTAPPTTTVRPANAPALGTATRTLAARRLSLSVRTPRELIIPVMTPLLFAIVIAPALATTFGARPGGIDYMTFVAVSTLGLLIPLSCMSSGLGVVVDRLNGARRDLLAAPVPKEVIVFGNLIVAVLLSALQVAVIIGASWLRGADFTFSAGGLGWFIGAALGFAVGMYGVAEILANRLQTQEEYIAALPGVAIVPYFFAGGLFPISALPAALTVVAKVLPITHVLALMRYGIADPSGHGLHDIWGMSSTTTMAVLSMTYVAAFAIALTAASIRVFKRTAVS